MAAKQKGGGGKLTRTSTVTVRLDPQLKFAAELAARKQRRTVSSFIEWAVVYALENYQVVDAYGEMSAAIELAKLIWDVDEPDRFAKLALAYPDLLNHEEQVLWKLICENGFMWRGKYDSNGEWTWTVRVEGLNFERLREYWDKFNKVASGDLEKDALPTWVKESTPSLDPNGDVPF